MAWVGGSHRALVALLAAALCAALPGAASAATVTLAGTTLVYTAAPGEFNNVSFSGRVDNGQKSITVSERGCNPVDAADEHACQSGGVPNTPYPVNADPGATHCVPSPGQVLCDAGRITAVRVVLGDKDNTAGFSNVDLPVDVTGGAGNDNLSGTGKPSVLTGGDGTNTMRGGVSADTITGGAGNDTILAGGGNDTIDTGAGGTNKVDAGDGNVTVKTGAGINDILGGRGNSDFVSGPGADRFIGGGGLDTISYEGRSGALNIAPGEGPVSGAPGEQDEIAADITVVTGGAGDDRIVAPAPPAGSAVTGYTLRGAGGNDTLIPHGGRNVLDGGDGDDLLAPSRGADTVIGGAGIDTVSYANRDEGVRVALDGQPGSGGPGDDTTVMTDVEDAVGGNGDDVIVGNPERNKLAGGPGDDALDGAGGDDVLDGGFGANTIRCGPGRSIVNYYWADDGITFWPNDLAVSGFADEADTISGDCAGVIGSPLGDLLVGGAGPTFLYGNGGDNTMLGGPAARDVLVAGEGNNYVNAMDGETDFVSCGAGVNQVLADAADSVAESCRKEGDTRVVGTAVTIVTPATVRPAGTSLAIPLACQKLMLDPCAGTLLVTAKVPKAVPRPKKAKKPARARKPAKAKTRARRPAMRKVLLGSVDYTVAPGATAPISLALSPAGLAGLRRLGRVSAQARVANTDRAGQVSSAAQTFVLSVRRRPAAPARP